MWLFRLDGPGFVKKVDYPDDDADLVDGQVRLRFIAAGLCGSDMPRFNGVVQRPWEKLDYGAAPSHETVAEVIESKSSDLHVGQRVVGTAGGRQGIAEFFTASDSVLIPAPEELGDVEALTIQSVATVIRAVNELPDVTNQRVAVIGAGPIGLAFLHVLKNRGAAHVVSIDPVERSETAKAYGADEFCCMRSTQWVTTLTNESRPNIVVEAVGHQQPTIPDAIEAVADGGFVYGFGSVDEPRYVIPYQHIYERNLTLSAGHTPGAWRDVLRGGASYVLEHRNDFATYVSHTIPIDDAQLAYSLYARPQFGRLKVALIDPH